MQERFTEESFATALARKAAHQDSRKYPDHRDKRFEDGLLLPKITPKFVLSKQTEDRIFTIGSCFARNIEDALAAQGFALPTRAYSVPEAEWPFPRRNGILNEFNPGAIAQRILEALGGPARNDDTIVPLRDQVIDLEMAGGRPVTATRASERRLEVQNIYKDLASCSAVIITLGFVEAWFDTASQRYLNVMPPYPVARRSPERFVLRRLGPAESVALLAPALDALCARGIKVLLSVSPVPMQTTFTGQDCIVANEYSKSVLRLTAETLCQRHALVDYVPSYEIIRTTGLAAFAPDHIHVINPVVQRVVAHMLEAYFTE